jgi:DNA-binding response OmpR family regulator
MANILIIEDNAALRKMLTNALSAEGHVIVEASDGGEGVKIFEREDFDLVITDIIMPRKWGIETIVNLRQTRPHVRVIAMSGAGRGRSEDLLKAAWSVGADAVLTKPFTVKDLRQTIASVLQKKPGP